ncbi:hypothetical protein [Tenacibaculum amylolyticum]|uniref:hypothetical protein n=1 Tax=Tenacibaculum amylolyticum TaxID=104269 RepID=UPI0038952B7D
MEKEFTQWQNLWKQKAASPLDIEKLIDSLNQMEKKGKLERIILLIAIIGTFVLLAILLPILSNFYYATSFSLIGFGMLLILFQVYKSKLPVIQNNIELTNHAYVQTLIKKLTRKMRITSIYMWIYTFLLISGMNIGYIEILQNFEATFSIKVLVHLLLSSVLLFGMYYSIQKRKQKNTAEIAPLIQLLESL